MFKKFQTLAKDWAIGAANKVPRGRRVRTLTMCRKCYTFFYRNSWHFERPDYLRMDQDLEIPVRFTECQACMEQEMAFYDMDATPVS
ncbi:MAG: hypothetical protein A2849_01700 [Candidatus Taylorbacteria bacterium RIFCSPHIGHO2_01_FULL_51_15]|uniref:Uncharacterized protein n=1 Tax=Candidatus Taylorbacteria bacterium RIFCSPHIGHO2_01_FULL_51_15 TaxID=1802304 RepID=A0A1G2MB02_9BACT|nr:MAG: hypothetical protein A2849_01700 [Candidatus Taylorbacteria bacterium RIFCSPHIGHO2_01_FULL_51_15]